MQNRIPTELLSFIPPSGTARLQLLQPIKITAESAVEDEMLTEYDLDLFANHLAKDLKYAPHHAAWHMVEWYRDQVGKDICTDAQGSLLRRMTIQRCTAGPLVVVQPAEDGVEESVNAITLYALLLLLFVFVGLVLHG